jgi:hypothetical protein
VRLNPQPNFGGMAEFLDFAIRHSKQSDMFVTGSA